LINSHQQVLQFYFPKRIDRKPLLRLLSSTSSWTKVAVWISSITPHDTFFRSRFRRNHFSR
jgi:hypothetical protein